MDTEQIDVDPSAIPAAPEMVDHEDGTTTIILDGNEPAKEQEWFSNLAETLEPALLDELAEEYLELIDQDMEAREARDIMQADGLKKAGLGDPAPGGASFEGASRATHPVLMEAYIDFSAATMREIFPPNGPVRSKIEGKPSKEKMERAKRKTQFMNWQLTQQVKSYRPEMERLTTQLPVGGSQYMKVFYDESRRRPNVEFVPIDDIVLPYEARNFFDVSRKFHRMTMTDLEYQRRVESGLYLDLSQPSSYMAAEEETDSQKQTARIEGKRANYTSDTGERIIYEGCIYRDIEEQGIAPYLITIDEPSRKVLAIYRNWDEDDEVKQELDYIVDFNFIPWRGVFALSLLQCLAGLPDALTGALRALLDSALISNMQGGLKLKSQQSGASLSIAPTQITEIDSMGQDDIRKVYMPIPFNQPSPVLFQLLGFLSEAAAGIVATAEEKISEASNEMPVGTALALLEQGAKVFSSIHARMHDSQRRCLEILHRINRDHLPEKFQYGDDPEDYILRSDFEGALDVHPVSDPNIFSETQRFAQVQFVIQTVVQMAGTIPGVASLFDLRKMFAKAFEIAKIPDYEEFLPPAPEALPLNPADENVDMVMGKPVKAFPGQNHQAHIQVHLDFLQNPFFGKSPIIQAKLLPVMLNHLQDHLLTWYTEMMKQDAAQGANPASINWDDNPDASVALAKACPVVDNASQMAFKGILPVVAEAMQTMQQLAPKPPLDPMVQIAAQEVAGKQQIAEGQLSLAQQKSATDARNKWQAAQQKAHSAYMDYDLALKKMGIEAQTDITTTNIGAEADIEKTIRDNQSAEAIAQMKVNSDEKTRLSTGASLSKD